MDALPIAPVVPRPDVQRVPGQRRSGPQGGFEKALEKEREGREAEVDAPAEQPTPSSLQPYQPTVRKNQDGGDHTIDVMV